MLVFFNKLLVMFIADWQFNGNAHSSSHQDLISNKLKVQQSCSLLLLRVCNYKLTRSPLQEVVVLQEVYKKWSECSKPFKKGTPNSKCYTSIFGSEYNSAKVYSSFTNLFGKDCLIAVQRREASYPKNIFSI